MHASLPVHSERLHDRDDPRVLAQPSGGKHAPVDVLWGRATEEILLAQAPFDGCELDFSLAVATDQFSGGLLAGSRWVVRRDRTAFNDTPAPWQTAIKQHARLHVCIKIVSLHIYVHI